MRNIALWQQARVTLIRIFHLRSHHDNAQMQATRKLLQRLGISPETYTFAHHNANSIVYMRLTLDRQFSKFRYIGCTWWAKNNNYHRFVPITIQRSIAPEQLEAVEATYIQQLQPKLNHPHIAPHMRKSLRFIHKQGHSKATGFRSIWAKVRRKRLPPRMQDIYQCHTFTSQVSTWSLLCDLSSNTRRRFEGIRTLLRAPLAYLGCAVWQAISPTSTSKPRRMH